MVTTLFSMIMFAYIYLDYARSYAVASLVIQLIAYLALGCLYICNSSGWHASREQTFDPRPKWVLVPAFFVPGTRETFSPGWWIQPGLKVPAQRLLL